MQLGPTRSASLSATCPAGGALPAYDVGGLNTWMSALQDLPQWQAADVGLTLPLQDGRTVWVFGDTLRPLHVSPRFVASSMLISSGQCVAQVLPAGGGPVIPAGSHKQVCWPTAGVVLPSPARTSTSQPATDQLDISCSRVRRGQGALNFTYLGLTMARFTVPRGGVPTLVKTWQVTPDDTDPSQMNWGSALLHDGDWIYIYGTRLQQRGGSARSLYVARAPVGALDAARAWTYWTGRDWVHDAARAQSTLPAAVGVSQSLTVSQVGDVYVMVSKDGGDFADDVGVWRSDTPLGPWVLSYTRAVPYDDGSGVLTYEPLAHPDLPLADGNLLVSLSRSPTNLTSLLADPALGRPDFIEVPLP
ncbi:DUF4185 domain-containing protein [Leekyejoonella antrihumi]|uniref:DUF4185 domain-containing protein n=1 Tax=Leekyejoonella antrihumi TaxID=1660198 RepID=UPI001646FC52|nr:DUF4185 domain-containing protein [Leekyejoonella antrihumi]